MRARCSRIRARYQHISYRVGHTRDTSGRACRIPFRRHMELGYGAVRYPAVYPDECIRHGGRDSARRTARTADGDIYSKDSAAAHCLGDKLCRRAACGYPVGRIRFGRNDRSRAGYPERLRTVERCVPARGDTCACGNDTSVHRQRIGDGAACGAAGV